MPQPTICGTRALRACWSAGCRWPSSRRSWAGAQRPRPAWRNGIHTSVSRHIARRWTPSTRGRRCRASAGPMRRATCTDMRSPQIPPQSTRCATGARRKWLTGLAPRAGLQPATRRLTGGIDVVSRALLTVALRCGNVRPHPGYRTTLDFRLVRSLPPLAGLCCLQRARKGQPLREASGRRTERVNAFPVLRRRLRSPSARRRTRSKT